MNDLLQGMVRAVTETFTLPEPILEVGSFQVEGQQKIANLRTFFPGREYCGLDMREGPGVDMVGNVEDLEFPDEFFGTVVVMSTFEHVQRFWKGFDEVHRVLRPDGALLVSCPFYFHVHAYPNDYWRFTPESLKYLLKPYPSKILGWHGAKRRPENVWSLAFREEHPGISIDEFREYCERMKQHARQPLPLMRRLRYSFGRIFCGRRPFVPWFERNHWESELIQEPTQRRMQHFDAQQYEDQPHKVIPR